VTIALPANQQLHLTLNVVASTNHVMQESHHFNSYIRANQISI
jgi:hypothetical protein